MNTKEGVNVAETATLRVSASTRRRVTHLATTLGQTQDTVIARGLAAIEQDLFWEGWNEEASSCLRIHGARESQERRHFSGPTADGEDR